MVNRLCREKVRLPSINATFQEGWLVRGGKDKSLTAMGADPATAPAAGRLATNFN